MFRSVATTSSLELTPYRTDVLGRRLLPALLVVLFLLGRSLFTELGLLPVGVVGLLLLRSSGILSLGGLLSFTSIIIHGEVGLQTTPLCYRSEIVSITVFVLAATAAGLDIEVESADLAEINVALLEAEFCRGFLALGAMVGQFAGLSCDDIA